MGMNLNGQTLSCGLVFGLAAVTLPIFTTVSEARSVEPDKRTAKSYQAVKSHHTNHSSKRKNHDHGSKRDMSGTCLGDLPKRSKTALTGSQITQMLSSLTPSQREALIEAEILSGNIPAFLRELKMIEYQRGGHQIKLWVTPDYLAVGSNKDFIRIPVTGASAQLLAKNLHCAIPTRSIVDTVYREANMKLSPRPIDNTTLGIRPDGFAYHNLLINNQIQAETPTGLIAGHKKDIVWSPRLASLNFTRVAIYGWHRSEHAPIQPLSLVHGSHYVDYSHGVRFVHNLVQVDGKIYRFRDVMNQLENTYSDIHQVNQAAAQPIL